MQVEVTVENIIKFNLVELTGNSSEVMMRRAKEAEEAGYVLTVEVPDDQARRMNVFEHGISPSGADERFQPDGGRSLLDEDKLLGQNGHGRVIHVDFSQIPYEGGEVVEGEVLDDDS